MNAATTENNPLSSAHAVETSAPVRLMFVKFAVMNENTNT
jgi:hypothetical protein